MIGLPDASGFRSRLLPPFLASCILCSVVLVALIAWIVADAYCPRTLALADLGFGRESFRLMGRDQRPLLHHWSRLGTREVLVWMIAILGLTSFIAVVAKLFVGGSGAGRGLREWGLFVALAAAWLALWASFDSLRWLGVRARACVQRLGARARACVQLRWYETTVEPLLRGRPSGSVELRGGLYHQGGWRGQEYLWATWGDSLHLLGDPARSIYRGQSGSLLLQMRPEEDCLVMYSPEPPGRAPGRDGPPVPSSDRLCSSQRAVVRDPLEIASRYGNSLLCKHRKSIVIRGRTRRYRKSS
jgi:hypothetical protein